MTESFARKSRSPSPMLEGDHGKRKHFEQFLPTEIEKQRLLYSDPYLNGEGGYLMR